MTMLLPTYLAADWRYAGDDWQGSNALTYTVYSTNPVFADDGVTVISEGTPLNLTGYTAQGTITSRPVPFVRDGRYQEAPLGSPLPVPTGAVTDPSNGVFTLSLPRAVTLGVPKQALSCWSDPSQSRLLVRPQIVDPAGNVITQGVQPLFVF